MIFGAYTNNNLEIFVDLIPNNIAVRTAQETRKNGKDQKKYEN